MARPWWLDPTGRPLSDRRKLAAGPTEADIRRSRWLRSHPVLVSIVSGTLWGLVCGLVFWLLLDHNLMVLIGWLVVGLVVQGPISTMMMMRQLDRSSQRNQ